MELAEIFRFSLNPLELVLRGSAMYWFLFLVFRTLFRRDVGAVTIADMLVLVLIADASQNAMAGDYKTVSDGCVLVLTIVGWNMLIDWLSFRFKTLRKILEPQPLMLIDRGRVLQRNLRKEFITMEELRAKLRENGVEKVEDVKLACMESDGEISVIKFSGDEGSSGKPKKPEVAP